VTFTPEELKALDVESSLTIDVSTFVPRADTDPVYFSTPYFVYPDGRVAAEAYSVIGSQLLSTAAIKRTHRRQIIHDGAKSGVGFRLQAAVPRCGNKIVHVIIANGPQRPHEGFRLV
jgi:hypothetical protein